MSSAGQYPLVSGDENRIRRALCKAARRQVLEDIVGTAARPWLMDRTSLTDAVLEKWNGDAYCELLNHLAKFLHKYNLTMVIREIKKDDPN